MRRLLTILGLLLALTAAGTIGLRVITRERWMLCLYMAVITLTTVGYGEAVELDDGGRAFIIVYLVLGLSVFTFGAAEFGRWIVSVEMKPILERRRMLKRIAELKNHFIVCGLGRMGEVICQYLSHRRRPFVVIDVDEQRLKEVCTDPDWPFVVGDATNDEALKAAGIDRARSLATVLPTDADNIYVTLSARLLSPQVQIVVRASEEKAIQKMQRAGATRVISPFSSGAEKMARFMINPSIEDFLEIADAGGTELELANVQIADDSPYIGKQLAETDLRQRGVIVIGIRRADGERLMPPSGKATIQPGDCLFTFGSEQAVSDVAEADEHAAG